MNYGLYLSASGALTNLYRQDVFANNLANAQTVGFKPDVPTIRQRAAESIEGNFGAQLRQRMLDLQGGGIMPGQQRINFSQGPLQATGNALDVALTRDDAFFAVSSTTPGGKPQVALTRDGRFTRNNAGQLVTIAGHHLVLDAENQPITLPTSSPVQISSDGSLVQDGEVVARVQVTGVQNRDRLTKRGENLLGFDGADQRKPLEGAAELKSGFVEGSGVDPIRALTNLVTATKGVSEAGRLIQFHDTLMDKAVNTLGRTN